MTDRELLELAAKAAGWVSWDWLAGDGVLNVYDAEGRHAQFNPLTDDGDALRLAVKCGISLTMKPLGCMATDLGLIDAYERFGDDPHAATRRAIVRAAAEIGKEPPPEGRG